MSNLFIEKKDLRMLEIVRVIGCQGKRYVEFNAWYKEEDSSLVICRVYVIVIQDVFKNLAGVKADVKSNFSILQIKNERNLLRFSKDNNFYIERKKAEEEMLEIKFKLDPDSLIFRLYEAVKIGADVLLDNGDIFPVSGLKFNDNNFDINLELYLKGLGFKTICLDDISKKEVQLRTIKSLGTHSVFDEKSNFYYTGIDDTRIEESYSVSFNGIDKATKNAGTYLNMQWVALRYLEYFNVRAVQEILIALTIKLFRLKPKKDITNEMEGRFETEGCTVKPLEYYLNSEEVLGILTRYKILNMDLTSEDLFKEVIRLKEELLEKSPKIYSNCISSLFEDILVMKELNLTILKTKIKLLSIYFDKKSASLGLETLAYKICLVTDTRTERVYRMNNLGGEQEMILTDNIFVKTK